MKDIQVPGHIQYLELISERLIVGYPSTFALYTVQGSGAPLALINNQDQSLSFLMQAPVEAMCAVEVQKEREYLLVFASLGVYVDEKGRRTRTHEIMWPAIPNAISKC